MLIAEPGADVQAHHHVLLGEGAEDRAPVVLVVVARDAFEVRQFRHRHRTAALGGHPADFGAHGLRVPGRQHGDRDEPVRVGAGPFVDMPVVIGRHHDQSGRILELVQVSRREAGEGREAHRGQDAVAAHIANALVHVVDAGPHLGEARRIPAPLLGRPRHHRVQATDPLRLALIDPLIDTVVIGDDDRRLLLVLGRDVVEEHIGRFDDVVVDAHQNQFVFFHTCSSRARRSHPTSTL
jgi:hypothetical protein